MSKHRATGWKQRLRSRTNVRSTAIHEAGHAVIACLFRWGILHIDIMPWGRLNGRVVLTNRKVRNAADARTSVLISVGGWAAESIHRRAPVAMWHYGGDYDAAAKLIRRWKLGDLSTFQRRAKDILRQPENRAAVRAVAKELVERGALSGRRLRGIVKQAAQ